MKMESEKQRNQVNVRLDDDTNTKMNQIAKAERIKKSEAVRRAINGELGKIENLKNKTLSEEERADVVKKLGVMMENISKIRTDNAKLGSNVNQIAKAANAGSERYIKQVEIFDRYGEAVGEHLERVAEELNDIWQLLA